MGSVVLDLDIEALAKTIREEIAACRASDLHERLVFTADDDGTAFGRRGDERLELLMDLIEVAIVVKMVGLDVRDEHRRRRKVPEGLVGLVGFDHVVAARARMRVATIAAHDAADEERRVDAHLVKRTRDHRGGRRLSVRAGDGHRVEPNSQTGKHLGAVPDGQATLLRRDELGVVVEHRRRDDHDVGAVIGARAGNVAGRMLPDGNFDARFLQLACIAAFLHVRTSHGHALVVRNARDAAHAHATDTDEMDGFDVVGVHGVPNLSNADSIIGCVGNTSHSSRQ